MLGDYRAINAVPTVFWIERRTCILIGVLAGCWFQHSQSILQSVLLFGILWSVVFSVQTWEPRLSRQMIRNLWHDRWRDRTFSAKKFIR